MECWRLVTINSIFLITAVVLLLNSVYFRTRGPKQQRLTRLKGSRVNTSHIRFPPEITVVDARRYDFSVDMDAGEAERLFYKFMSAVEVQCDISEHLGWEGDGSWPACLVPPYRPTAPCLAYSFGINYDFGFDDDISEKYGCYVRSFDPSMEKVGEHLHSARVRFYPLGLGARREERPSNGWIMDTYAGLLKEFKETQNIIDYLKFDIEASEWEVLPSMYESGLLANVKQLGFEVHTYLHVIENTTSVTTDQLIRGYRTLHQLHDWGFRKWYHHTNPHCNMRSPHLNEIVSTCHEVVYININFLDDGYITLVD